ncbi:MAG: YncE family protein [Vicinamibacterales bacterium]
MRTPSLSFTATRVRALAVLCAAALAGFATATPGLARQSAGPVLLVLNKVDATLAFVDPATGEVTAKVPTGDGPHELVVSTDGRLAFATNYGGNTPGSTISIIDVATRTERKRLDVSPLSRPHGLAFAGGKLYVTAETNRLFARYDPAADRIDWMLGTGQGSTHMIWVNDAVSLICTANISGNSISIFERPGSSQNWNATVVPTGRGPEGFDVSPTGASSGPRTRRTAACRSSTWRRRPCARPSTPARRGRTA